MKNILYFFRLTFFALVAATLFVSCWSHLPESKCESTVNGELRTGVC